MTRISFLGPRGSFAEAALRSMPAAGAAELVPAASVFDAMDLARSGAVDQALVPIENSIEGSVPLTLDELSRGDRLVIADEVVLPVRFSLLARPGTALTDVTRIATHPHAHAQVRGWLRAHLPEASILPALSTSAAAAGLIEVDDLHAVRMVAQAGGHSMETMQGLLWAHARILLLALAASSGRHRSFVRQAEVDARGFQIDTGHTDTHLVAHVIA